MAKLYLGVALRALKRTDEAEAMLLASHAILEKARDARPDDWYWVNVHLAAHYREVGKTVEARRYDEAARSGPP